MNSILIDILVVLVLTLVSAFFVAAEISLVSLRESQVQRIAEERGRKGERLARLVHNPNRFLAAVQIAVTTMAFVSAGFGASELAPRVSPSLVSLGHSQGAADTVAFIVVTVVLVYVTLVLGELAPKRIGLQRAETLSVAVAGVVEWLARLARPFIVLLSISTDAVVRLVGGDPKAGKELITDEELRGILASQGTLSPQERELIDDVFEAGDRELREIMVPRTEVEFLNGDVPVYKAARLVTDLPYSRYPVCRASQDDVIGFVHIRDILAPSISDRGIRLEDLVREILYMPGTKHVLPAMSEMRATGTHVAVVVDEYGGTAGIVTLEDLVEELVGDIRDEYDVEERPDTSALGDREVDGLLNLEDFEEEVGVELPEGPYETVAGYVVSVLGRLAVVGESVRVGDHTLTITELDGHRASRILVSHAPVTGSQEEEDVVGESPA